MKVFDVELKRVEYFTVNIVAENEEAAREAAERGEDVVVYSSDHKEARFVDSVWYAAQHTGYLVTEVGELDEFDDVEISDSVYEHLTAGVDL